MEVLDSRHTINIIPFLWWKWPVEGGGGRRWAGGTECQEVRGLEREAAESSVVAP